MQNTCNHNNNNEHFTARYQEASNRVVNHNNQEQAPLAAMFCVIVMAFALSILVAFVCILMLMGLTGSFSLNHLFGLKGVCFCPVSDNPGWHLFRL